MHIMHTAKNEKKERQGPPMAHGPWPMALKTRPGLENISTESAAGFDAIRNPPGELLRG
jgi:hypothetical protein